MKRLCRLIALICILCLLGGCGLVSRALRLFRPETDKLGAEPEMTEFHTSLYSDGVPVYLWGRDQLSLSEQEAYDAIDRAAAARQESPVTVDIGEEDRIQRVLSALRVDHPEYFWFDGEASFVTTSVAGVAVKTECTLSYTMEMPEIQEAHQLIEQYTAACLAELSRADAQTDYEKILGVYRYLIETTDYVCTEPVQSIVSAMVSHRATCAGYSRSFQYLMNQLGIPCTLALGEGLDGEAHGWNMVRCGGDWYQMDVTWGDPVGPEGEPGSSIQYTYCMVTDEEIYRDHILDSDFPMPVCNADTYNYYVQTGRQLDVWDPDVYSEKMSLAAEAGEDWFCVRFTDPEAYGEAVEALFTEDGIWDALRSSGMADGKTHVVYSQNDLFYEISVRLNGEEEGD